MIYFRLVCSLYLKVDISTVNCAHHPLGIIIEDLTAKNWFKRIHWRSTLIGLYKPTLIIQSPTRYIEDYENTAHSTIKSPCRQFKTVQLTFQTIQLHSSHPADSPVFNLGYYSFGGRKYSKYGKRWLSLSYSRKHDISGEESSPRKNIQSSSTQFGYTQVTPVDSSDTLDTVQLHSSLLQITYLHLNHPVDSCNFFFVQQQKMLVNLRKELK